MFLILNKLQFNNKFVVYFNLDLNNLCSVLNSSLSDLVLVDFLALSDRMFLPFCLLRLRHRFLRLLFLKTLSCNGSWPRYAFLINSTTFVKTHSISTIILRV